MSTHRGEGRSIGLVAVFVAVLCSLPVLVNPSFYFSDDSAAQFLPMWHVLGERLLRGDWPLMLDVDSWMGGNLAAESLFGVWNPVQLLDYVLVVWLGDLAVAATVVKTQFLIILAVGVHVLSRSYGANRACASVLGVALPVSGFVLYFQAATWAGGLMGFAWLPWAWWSLRRLSEGGTPLLPFLFCYLCVSAGDPYGALALCLLFAALVVEFRLAPDGTRAVPGRRAVVRVVWVGVAVALTMPLIFGPLVAASSVSWRSGFALFNDGLLVPGLSDLANLSMPSFVPRIQSFGSFRMTVPATYFAWFAVPLAAWLDWRVLLASWRRCAAPLLLAGCYLLLCLGPSHVWLFRWPLRHVAVLYLALSVVLAVVISSGLRTDRVRVRVACTVGTLVVGFYLSFSAWPGELIRHLVALGLISGLVLVIMRGSWPLAVALHIGTACALALQIAWYPINRDVANYHFPTRVDEIREQWAGLRRGTVVQIADRELVPADEVASRAAWNDLLFGNMHSVAGVPSLTAYTGIGFRALHRRLCLSYYGSTCPRAYGALWTTDEIGAVMADQLKVDHVVVQRDVVEVHLPPPGWRIAERTRRITRLDRIAPSPWSTGRVSVARGISVVSDRLHGQRQETIHFRRIDGREADLVFARLDWPGYRATVDGRPVPVTSTSAGLVHVRIPPGTGPGELRLSWTPPGWNVELGLASIATLMMTAASFTERLRVRGRRC